MKRFIIMFLMIVLFAHPVFADNHGLLNQKLYDYRTMPWGIMSLVLFALVIVLLFRIERMKATLYGASKQTRYDGLCFENKNCEEKKTAETIIKGLENDEFKMYLQFIVDNKTKRIVSCEALSRWHNQEKGLVGPGEYIGTMESTGLISKHDFYMFELACRQLEKWKDTEFEEISLSCNFTRITLSEENFAERLENIANQYQFDRAKLAIEITEDVMEKNREIATKNVIKCKNLGFKMYLDDLGSGYTSLTNLRDYSLDVVKIDRDILLRADTDKGKALFSGIISLAHSLNIEAICEGVENEEQNELVSSSECDYIQGWYYSKPIPAETCETFLKSYLLG